MRAASLALIVLTAIMIAGALWTVGGPEQARAERRDQTRMNDLQSLGQHLICLHGEGLGIGDRSDACPDAARRLDPLTGEPYRVQVVSDDVIRLCADFETRLSRQWWAGHNDFDPDAGCLVVRLREPVR